MVVLTFCCLFFSSAVGQTVYCRHDIALAKANTSAGIVARPVPGAQIRVCAKGSVGSPCNPPSNIFDINGNAIVNPATADSNGNFVFCVTTPGRYMVQVGGTGVVTLIEDNVLIPTDSNVFPSLAPDGSVSAPSYSFINETNTGMYRAGLNSLAFSIGGIQRMTLGAGSLVVIGGSPQLQAAGAGGIFAAGNPADVALWRSAAQTWQIGANGTDRNGALSLSPNSQSLPIISARSNTFRTTGNSLEFGHANSAGYGSNLGWETTSGFPFVCFMCEGGTNANTYRTRGNTASIIRADTGGVLVFGSVASTNADNQSIVNNFQITTTTGNLVSNGTLQGTVINATTGFRISGAAAANTFLKGNGTNYVSGSPVLASADFANQGTITTVLHGNAAGNPTFGSVVSADLNITTTTCTNQFLTAISATGTGTCTTDVLASAQHANQGTTTTVLHGNAAGNPTFAGVSLTTDTSANQGTTTTVLHGNAAGQPSFGSIVAADCPTCVVNNAANTFTSSGTIDLSSASVTSGLRIPIAAAANPTVIGVFSFDSTGGTGGYVAGFGGSRDRVVFDTQTTRLTQKRIDPRITTLTTSTTFTPDSDNADQTVMNMTGVAGTITIAAPTGTPTDGQKHIIRLKTTNAQTYSFNATYRFSTSVTAPTATTATKTDYIGIIWNNLDTKWDVVAVDQGH